MKYAVIRIKGNQFKVSEGEEILVDKVAEDEKIAPEVLMLKTDKSLKLGEPIIDGAKISLKRLTEEQGEKIHVYKYKSKSRYRRKIGHRSKFTRFLVESIG